LYAISVLTPVTPLTSSHPQCQPLARRCGRYRIYAKTDTTGTIRPRPWTSSRRCQFIRPTRRGPDINRSTRWAVNDDNNNDQTTTHARFHSKVNRRAVCRAQGHVSVGHSPLGHIPPGHFPARKFPSPPRTFSLRLLKGKFETGIDPYSLP